MKRLIFLSMILVGLASFEASAGNPAKRKLNKTDLKEMYSETRFTEFGASDLPYYLMKNPKFTSMST